MKHKGTNSLGVFTIKKMVIRSAELYGDNVALSIT